MKKHWILLTAIALVTVGLVTCSYYSNDLQIGLLKFKYFSTDDYGIGIFSIGKFSIGIFSIGIFSIGVFSIGIFNIGLYAIGLFIIGWRKRLPHFLQNQTNSNISEIR